MVRFSQRVGSTRNKLNPSLPDFAPQMQEGFQDCMAKKQNTIWLERRKRFTLLGRYQAKAKMQLEKRWIKNPLEQGGFMEQFYASVTTCCFLLMGLWWSVMQFRHIEWSQDVHARRMSYDVYLSFLLPGIMSMAAQIGGDLALLWRMVFAVVGVMGLMTALWSIPRVMARYPNLSFLKYGRWFMVLLYIALIFVAVAPNLAILIKPLKPIQLEGMLVSLILFVGVNVAWEFMSQPKDEYAQPVARAEGVPDMPITG
jgi:hypothetical protein